MHAKNLSGIQPTGELHLGNYLGAIREHILNQDDSFYFVANYHALTTVADPQVLRDQTWAAAATYLACGLDPSKATLFRQSDVPEVTELMWLLLPMIGAGHLKRAVSFKDKVTSGLPPSAGLLAYPVLMAADILAYRSRVVPVGPDQVQHVEMARDMAKSFNRTFGPVFQVPEYRLGTPDPIPGTDGNKMSKSHNNTIPLFCSERELRRRANRIETSSSSLEEPKDPESCIVFSLYSRFANEADAEEMRRRYVRGGMGYGAAKKKLADVLWSYFSSARRRFAQLQARPELVEQVLLAGAKRARSLAREVTAEARRAVGLS